jgi:hypothetical protein
LAFANLPPERVAIPEAAWELSAFLRAMELISSVEAGGGIIPGRIVSTPAGYTLVPPSLPKAAVRKTAANRNMQRVLVI